MVAMARRRRSLMLTVFLAVFLVILVVGLLLPPKYSSSMKILVRSAPTDMVSTPERADGVTLGTVSEAEVNSEVELLTSYDLLRAAVVKNHLAHDGLLSHGNEQENIDRAVRKLGKSLVVTPVRKANIIEVEYADRTPELAAAVLRSIESGYLAAHLRAQSTPGGYAFFKAQASHYQDELTRSQGALADFSRQQNVANLDQQKNLLTGTLAERGELAPAVRGHSRAAAAGDRAIRAAADTAGAATGDAEPIGCEPIFGGSSDRGVDGTVESKNDAGEQVPG